MRKWTFFILVLCTCLLPVSLYAQDAESPVDSTLQISLLTCSPGQASYELYGHTAIRVKTEEQGYDVVFNYGVFDFYQPHFVWRFVLGECDYMVAPYRFALFRSEYAARGSSVTEQVLNLLPFEAQELATALWQNCAPANRVYRYNIFRNNCTTKSRDIIEEHIYGRVIYPVRPRRNTFRTILHQFTKGHDWDQEGNDLLLGADVDTLINERDEMFAPIYLMWYVDSAMIDRGRHRYSPLVRERRVLLEENPSRQHEAAMQEPSFPLSPCWLGWGVLGIGFLLSCWEMRRRRILWALDLVLMLLQGFAGVLLTFMLLFSQHPGVSSNWQVWVLNPLPLLFIVPVIRATRQGESCIYHRFAAAVLVLFVLFSFVISQDFSTLIIPLALLLLSRAIVHLIIEK